MKKEPTYKDLRKKYSDEEIVDSFVLRSSMTDEERASADAEFRRLRLEQLKNMSDKQILKGELMRMKLLQSDYFKQPSYSVAYSFEQQLKNYIDLVKKSKKSIAEDLDIHPTKLSRILNAKENPNIDLMYRLERHSGNMIPTTHWYRLFTRKVEHDIIQNTKHRQEQYDKVKNTLSF